MKKALPPFALALLGVALLIGCIPVPTFNKVVSGKDASRSIGAAGSKRPLVTGNATLRRVLDTLGPPAFVDPDGRRIAYRWRTLNNVTIWPLCAWVTRDENASTLVLRFGTSETLEHFELKRDWAGNDMSSGHFEPPPPGGMVPFDPVRWPAVSNASASAPPQRNTSTLPPAQPLPEADVPAFWTKPGTQPAPRR